MFLEAIMKKRSTLHPYLNWTKTRIDEMDVALAALEANAGRLGAEFKSQSDRMIADLRKRRDRFAALVGRQSKADKTVLARAKKQLGKQWKDFDSTVEKYFHAVEKHFAPRQTALQKIAAQAKTWRKAARALRG